ncbi:hypothetical protein PTKIN_Ptkin01aG0255600 [Pterospermum kingtungense]
MLWRKPVVGFLKCNTDEAVFQEDGLVGMGLVVRDESGHFVAARVLHFAGKGLVKELEALVLLEALAWLQSMNYHMLSLSLMQNLNECDRGD